MSGQNAVNDAGDPAANEITGLPATDSTSPDSPDSTDGGIVLEGLDEFNQGVLAEFQPKTTSDDTDDRTQATGTDGDEASDGGAEADASDGQETSSATGERPDQPDDTTSSSSSSSPDAPDVYLGRPRSDIEAALQTYDWARGLPPDALSGIDAFLSGDYVLVPRSQVEAGGVSSSAPASTGGQTPSSVDDDLDDLDPAAAARLRTMQQEIDSLRQATQSQVQASQTQREQDLLAAIDRGGAAFAASHDLTTEELERVYNTAARLSTIQTGMQANPNDMDKAVSHALDLAYLSDADFRQREIDRLSTKKVEEQRVLAERKARAGAVTASSGSITKPSPTPPSQMTGPERDKAIADEIAAAMTAR